MRVDWVKKNQRSLNRWVRWMNKGLANDPIPQIREFKVKQINRYLWEYVPTYELEISYHGHTKTYLKHGGFWGTTWELFGFVNDFIIEFRQKEDW